MQKQLNQRETAGDGGYDLALPSQHSQPNILTALQDGMNPGHDHIG